MENSKIGAQLYTLRDYLKTPAEIVSTLHKVRAIGYQAVQISGLGPIPMVELKKNLDDEGLIACATHTGYEMLVRETEKVIEDHKILGAAQVSCPGLPGEYHNEEGYKKAAQELSRVGSILKRQGITLSYHNHGIEFEQYGSKIGLEILFEESDPRYLQAEIDTYWVQYGGGDPAAWCQRLKGRLPLVHVKDMSIKNNQQIMAEVGSGNLNWETILKACKEAGTLWYLVEQDVCQRHPLESLKISLENLHNMGLA